MSGERAVAVALVLLAACTGCTLTHDHGLAIAEASAETCHDGIDQDLDRLVDCADADCDTYCHERSLASCSNGQDEDRNGLGDCADPSCDGYCPERSPSACANGRDDDGDGRLDALDAECWPVADVTFERCASVVGGDTPLGPASTWLGDARPATDTSGRYPASTVLHDVGGRPFVAGPPLLVPGAWTSEVYPGALEGTRLDLGFRTGEVGMGVALGDVDLAGALADGIVVTVRPRPSGVDLTLAVVTGGSAGLPDTVNIPGLTVGWLDLHLEVAAGRVRATLTRDGTLVGRELGAVLPAGFPEDRPMRLIVEGSRAGTTPTLVGVGFIHRETLERCGVRNPPFGLQTRRRTPRIARTGISGVVRGPGRTLCAVGLTQVDLALTGGVETPDIYTYQSDDDGATWTRAALVARQINPLPIANADIAYDVDDARYHVVYLDVFAGPTPHLALFHAEGATCADVGAPRDTGIDVAMLNAVVDEYRVTDSEHVLRLHGGIDGTFDSGELTYRSPWGLAGTWVRDEALDASLERALPAPPGVGGLLAPDYFMVGRDEAALVSDWASNVELLVRGAGESEWRVVPSFLITPSAERGAFDAYQVLLADMLEDPDDGREWRGRVFYGGLFDPQSWGWGWGYLRIRPVGAP